MTPEEKRATQIAEAIGRLAGEAMRAIHCCPNCLHFDGVIEQCKLASARPPAQVIAFGCEKFDFDIPF